MKTQTQILERIESLREGIRASSGITQIRDKLEQQMDALRWVLSDEVSK